MNLDEGRALVERFDALCAAYRSEYPDVQLKGGRGRQSIMARAMDQIAQEHGKDWKWVNINVWVWRRKLERMRVKAELTQPIPSPNDPDKKPARQRFNSWGLHLNESWLHEVHVLDLRLKKAAKMAREVERLIQTCIRDDLPVRGAQIRSLRASCEKLAADLWGSRPAFLCPYCKGIDSAQKRCVMCATLGYLTRSQNYKIPSSLKDTKNPVIMVGRDTVPIAEPPEDT